MELRREVGASKAGSSRARRGIALACLLTGMALMQPVQAEDEGGTGPGGSVTPKDVRRLFENVLFSTCQEGIGPIKESFKNEIPQIANDPNLEKNVCRCTVRQALAGPRMRSIFEMPPEKLQNLSSDGPTMNYFKGKVAANMLLCLGAQLDALVEPKGNRK